MPRLTWRHRLARGFRPARLPAAAEPAQPAPPSTRPATHPTPSPSLSLSPTSGPDTHPAPYLASGPDACPAPPRDTGAEVPPGAGAAPPGWEDSTVSFPRVGRVGWLTLAQEWRANRGRR